MPEKIVLVADADPEMHRLLGAAMSAQDFRTIAAWNGEDALAIARTEHPELIVTDLGTPRLDGFAVVGQLKSDPRTAGIPVLAVTGDPYPELQQRVRLAGFDALLIKPVTATTLGDVGRLLVERAALLEQRSSWQRGPAARARADEASTAEATRAEAETHRDRAGAGLPATPTCRRCGSEGNSRVVRTTRSSATYRCGTCRGQWRLTVKNTPGA